MIKVAITGNIASGKSTAEAYITSMGFKVIDTDKVNHSVLAEDLEAINEIKSVFKDYDILSNGEISKKKLGNIVFADNNLKIKLENILHKKIFEKVDKFINENSDEKIIFISVPLLFEIKVQKLFDKIIFVSADEKTRLNRLMKRNNLTLQEAKMRINSQQNEALKLPFADYIIYNNSSIDDLKNQTQEVINNLINAYMI